MNLYDLFFGRKAHTTDDDQPAVLDDTAHGKAVQQAVIATKRATASVDDLTAAVKRIQPNDLTDVFTRGNFHD